jgi:hypothetical protein
MGIYSTTLTIFNVLTGRVWLPDVKVADSKYEGIAFIG